MSFLLRADRSRLEDIILRNTQRFADDYGKSFQSWSYYRQMSLYKYRTVIEMILVGSPKTVIDMGCGNNILIRSLAEFRPDIECFGIDVSKNELEYGIQQESQVHFLRADILDGVPFRDGSIDAILSSDVIEHLDYPGQLLQEAGRLLKTGGRFVVTCPHSESITQHMLRLMRPALREKWLSGDEILHPEFCFIETMHPGVHRVEGYGKDSISRLAQGSGMTLGGTKTHGVFLTGSKLYNLIPESLLRFLFYYHDFVPALPGFIATLEKMD